jgi:hypothetical protein
MAVDLGLDPRQNFVPQVHLLRKNHLRLAFVLKSRYLWRFRGVRPA